MITLSNNHSFEYMVASGALAFDGLGWPWERPLVALGLIKPELFTTVIKTLTRNPRPGNLRWWKPWSCIRLIRGGSVNKVGLTNPGVDWWCENVAPGLDFNKYHLVGSIFGDKDELLQLTWKLSVFNLVAIEVNPSCPNTGHAHQSSEYIVDSIRALKAHTMLPIIVKVSADQDYLSIAKSLEGVVEAISLNSVPWKTAFPNGERSPLWRLENKVGGGSGGVSGKPAQPFNWQAVRDLSRNTSIPVIGPSIMEYDDMRKVRSVGARAVSFGAIHIRTPWKPTKFVKREMAEKAKSILQ